LDSSPFPRTRPWPNWQFQEAQAGQHPSGEPIFGGPTCFLRRQERMIMSRIFSSAEPDPQLTWTAMVSDIFLVLQFLKSCLRCFNMSEWANVPKRSANKVFSGIIQQIYQERVYVSYQSRVPIENQDSILGCFKKSTVSGLRRTKRRFRFPVACRCQIILQRVFHEESSSRSCRGTLVVQDDIKPRAMDLQPAAIVNKAQFPEPVHEEADPRAGCADHLPQHLLTESLGTTHCLEGRADWPLAGD